MTKTESSTDLPCVIIMMIYLSRHVANTHTHTYTQTETHTDRWRSGHGNNNSTQTQLDSKNGQGRKITGSSWAALVTVAPVSQEFLGSKFRHDISVQRRAPEANTLVVRGLNVRQAGVKVTLINSWILTAQGKRRGTLSIGFKMVGPCVQRSEEELHFMFELRSLKSPGWITGIFV